MPNYFDKINVNGVSADVKSIDGDRLYPGVDLTVKFADEIAQHSDVWAWLHARIQNANYDKLHVGDFIPFTCTNGVQVNAQIAGIDSYYHYGDSEVPHHIDFISRELWPTTVQMNPVNINNGISGAKVPWLCTKAYAFLNSKAMNVPNGTTVPIATTAVDYSAGGVYYYLPTALKNRIIEKRIYAATRQSDSGILTTDNSAEWANMGKLWLPSEVEVDGSGQMTTPGWWAGGYIQYPIFANNMNRLKVLGVGGGRHYWWCCSPYSGNSAYFVLITDYGQVGAANASGAIGVPVCFRIS